MLTHVGSLLIGMLKGCTCTPVHVLIHAEGLPVVAAATWDACTPLLRL